jgi:site-specific recombinase XerD
MKYPPEPLTRDDILKLMAACSTRGACGIRNKALIALLWRTGARISEALALRPADLDPKAGTVRVRRGKGGRYRVVGLDPATFALVGAWLERRRALGVNGHSTVFCTLDGEVMKTAYVRVMLPRLGKRAGLERRVHAHAMRHALATELAAEGTPLVAIQGALGHSNITTTARYIGRLAPQAVIDAMKGRTWNAD